MAEKRTRESYRENQGRKDRLEALIASDPEGAAALLEKIAGKVLRPHSDGQREILMAQERFLTLCAGRRWGKTKIGAARGLRECRTEAKIVWWVAPTYRIAKRGYAEVLKQLPDGVLTKPAPPEGGFDAGRSVVLHFKNGARMEFFSAERPESMLGGSSDFVIVDEAASLPEATWTQFIRPTLADRQGGALFISTPRSKNWFYRLWAMGQDELEGDYRSWLFPSFTNPTIPAEEFVEMERTLPRAVYEQEVLAQFVSAAASVFRIPDTAIVPVERPQGHVVLGVDLAKLRDFSVIVGVNAGNRRPCYHDRFNAVSWPEQRARLHRCVANLIRDGATGVTVMLDSTGLGDVIYDDLSFEGLDAVPIKFTNSWKQQAVSLLSADLERGDAFIIEPQFKEFEGYAYTISETTGRWKFEASSGHDDEVSAALLAHWGIVNYGVPNVMMLSEAGTPALPAGTRHPEADIVDGVVVEEYTVEPPTASDLLNNPSVWF